MTKESNSEPPLFEHGAQYLEALRERAGLSHTLTSEGHLRCLIGDLDLTIASDEDLFVLHEIFLQGIYAFRTRHPVVIWDIGAHSAFAARAVAARPDVVAIRSFEPFRGNQALARINLARNTRMAEKIELRPYGVGATSGPRTAYYSSTCRGRSTIHRPEAEASSPRYIEELVNLLAADETLLALREEFPSRPLVAKIDCEGAEYEIVAALAAAELLSELELVMLEWHQRGPDELVETLVQAGFTCFAPRLGGLDTGMVYAQRNPVR